MSPLADILMSPSVAATPVYAPDEVILKPAPTVFAPRARSIASPVVCIAAPLVVIFSPVPVVRAAIDIDWPVPTVDAFAVRFMNVAAPVVEVDDRFMRLPVNPVVTPV